MKAVDGVNLAEVLNQTEQEHQVALVEEVRQAVRKLYARRHGIQAELEKAGRAADKARKSLQKLDDRLEAIRQGRWDVLNNQDSESNQNDKEEKE
ncbi:MAG: hypothetical protein ACRCZI_11470 [Cetobacterium sp.]